ncbi:unnamed protein product [Mytilus edulis]|uniref:Vwde helical domain-containing protein n=1 Tax=Mytilus edulis TaxID=6550 RepID=A0A8S3UGD8_MYTED|nr:unnamed protein product [Mytilus edulis]
MSVKPDDSLFIAKARGSIINAQQYFCSCVNKSTETETKFSDEADCDWQDAMPLCPTPRFEEEMCTFRAKRDVNDDMDIDIPVDIVKYKPAPPNIGQWINGWNESAAVDKCRKVLHASKFYRQCKDIVPFNETESMRSCVEDIKFLGHSNLSSQVDKPLRESCLNMIRINTTLWTGTSNGSNPVTSKLVSIIENDCPSDCSVEEEKRGSCNNGMP